MNYNEALKSPKWQKKRLEIMERDGWKCCMCGNTENQLNVHHMYYVSGKKPYEYDDEVYVTLCKDCHTSTHNEITKISSLIALCVVKRGYTFIDVKNCLKAGRIL